MKAICGTAIAAALVLTLPACSQEADQSNTEASEAAASIEALNGTYKADLASLKFEQKPDEYLLQDGTYKCSTCTPPVNVAADGQFHAVADQPYYDSMSVNVVDERTVEFKRRKGDKEVSSNRITVSEDGKTLTNAFVNSSTPNAPPIEGTATATRAGAGPQGAHALSGQWMPDRIQDYSEEALNISFQVNNDQVTMNSQGQTYTAKIGGEAVPIEGDTGGTMVKLSRDASGGLRETYMRDGKEIGYAVVVPSSDGKSMTYSYTDARDGSKTTWSGNKQG